MHPRRYYVYLLANRSHTLYIGVTNDLERRVREHRCGSLDGFMKRYHVTRLVYYETYQYIGQAIRREKQLKGWLRAKKIELIESRNKYWIDLAADWYQEPHRPEQADVASTHSVPPGSGE